MTSGRSEAICSFLLQWFSVMGVSNTVKTMLVKLFNHLAMNEHSNIALIFSIILKDKLLLNVLIEISKLNYYKTEKAMPLLDFLFLTSWDFFLVFFQCTLKRTS